MMPIAYPLDRLAARCARRASIALALLVAARSGFATAQDPSAGRTTPPSSTGTAPPAGAVVPTAPAPPTTTTIEVPVKPSDTAVAPVKPGSTTTVPVNPGATTVVPVAPGTNSIIVQDPSAKDPNQPGAQIRVPIPTADPAKPGGGTVIPIPGRDPNAPDGTITVVPDATKPPLEPNKPKGDKETEAPVIKPKVEEEKKETITVETNDPSSAYSAANTQGNAPAEEKKPRIRSNFCQAAYDSLFGRTDYATWEVLPFRTLFTEGWDEAWIGPPNGSRGGPRQGWIGAADGNFYRLNFLSFDYTGGLNGGGDGYAGGYTLYTPLSRRLLLITQVPFVNSNFASITVGREQLPTGGDGTGTGGGGFGGGPQQGRRRATGFGDLSFTPRVMLYESQNFSWTAGMTVQIPTGDRYLGGSALVTPTSSFWWNFAERWVVRGGFATGIGTNRQAGGTTLISRLAVGRTFTKHDVPIFGDFTIYVASNTFNNVTSGSTLSTIGPGFRTHLGNSYYFLGATTIPLTGPKPYVEGATFWLMKVY